MERPHLVPLPKSFCWELFHLSAMYPVGRRPTRVAMSDVRITQVLATSCGIPKDFLKIIAKLAKRAYPGPTAVKAENLFAQRKIEGEEVSAKIEKQVENYLWSGPSSPKQYELPASDDLPRSELDPKAALEGFFFVGKGEREREESACWLVWFVGTFCGDASAYHQCPLTL